MSTTQWRPTASIEHLRFRAGVLASVRAFFEQRHVLEVETPVLSHCAVSDPFIDSIEALYATHEGAEPDRLFLQTSPEYAMKRLLAAGSGAIYQMGKAFRNSEAGRRHNPEFTMLEWYRPGFDDNALMDEVEALVVPILSISAIERMTYAQAFQYYLEIDPFEASLETLIALTRQHMDIELQDEDRDTWLNLLMSHVIEPRMKDRQALFVVEYPASQAALAKVRPDAQGRLVAARFELFVQGMELANGYHELTDANEQKQRLLKDQQSRATLALPQRPLEMRLVSALEAGMPECAGVALGIDRLVMLALQAEHINDVISFPLTRA
ncbi:MAG: elongation factor P--(R)-beta-lysine ligase [Pontibacterium sp.]